MLGLPCDVCDYHQTHLFYIFVKIPVEYKTICISLYSFNISLAC